MFKNLIEKKKGNIWMELKNKNPEGIFVLAPMADVTDNPFRKVISEIGKPDLFFTEFVAADGLAHPDAQPRLIKQILNFEKKQAPIIAQIFGGNPKNYFLAAKISADLNFNGVDINTGCPQRNILKQIAGSELIKKENRELVADLIKSAKDGIKASGKNIPLSVKTRLGFNEVDFSWIEFLLKQNISALTVHLRTKKEMSKVPAHFEHIEKIVELKNKIAPKTVLIINGDVKDLKQAKEIVKKYSVDGVMIGRGIFENPMLFAEKDFSKIPIKEKLEIVKKHTIYFDKEFPEKSNYLNKCIFQWILGEKNYSKKKRMKNFALLKKFFKIYINGFDGAKELRQKLMNAKNKKEILELLNKFK